MPGGHVIQIEKTAHALTAAGLTVACDYSDHPELAAVDLVHGFGLSPAEIRPLPTPTGRRWSCPPSTGTAPTDQTDPTGGPGPRAVAGRMARAARFAHAALRGRAALLDAGLEVSAHEWQLAGAYEAADLLLPNARGEAASIWQDLRVSTPMVPVPNGVDPQSFSPPSGSFADRGYVLFVGRIDPHKNQLGAIRALRGFGAPDGHRRRRPSPSPGLRRPVPPGGGRLGDLHRTGGARLG